MDLNTLRWANVERCENSFRPINSWSTSDWATAFAGECGEVCDAVKKLNRLRGGATFEKDPQTPEECKTAIAHELADVICYADLLAASLDIDLGSAIREKFNIVSQRVCSDVWL